MLGAPCSPCCGGCTDARRQAIFDDIAARACEITLAPGLPYQDAAAITANSVAMVDFGNLFATNPTTGESWLNSNLYIIHFRQHETASGTHSLSLDMSETQMFFQNGDMCGIVVFRKTTESYSIRVRFLIGCVSNTPPRFQYPETDCYCETQASVVLKADQTFFIQQPPPLGVVTVPREYETRKRWLAYADSPYYRRASTGLASSVLDRGTPVRFDALWDFDAKPASESWVRGDFASYSWSLAASDPSSLSFSADSVAPFVYWPVSQWKPFTATDDTPDWISGISFDDDLQPGGGGQLFYKLRYSAADRFYSEIQMSSASLASSQVVLL